MIFFMSKDTREESPQIKGLLINKTERVPHLHSSEKQGKSIE
jgi:hypothetical protein